MEKGYFHHEGIAAASARLVGKQASIDITADWGGGLVASVDGMRFVVPVRSLHARPSPLYYGIGKRSRGATWLNTVSDKVMGLGGLLVPGTLRDSLFILDAIHRLDATGQPEVIITDTASYSDVVYGMFAICGYQSPLCWPAAGPGLVGRWGPADRPCGICGLLSLWPLGRCRAGRVIPSVGGVPELPASPVEGTRDDRDRQPY